MRSEERRVGKASRSRGAPELGISKVRASVVAPALNEPKDRLVGEHAEAVTRAGPVTGRQTCELPPAALMLRVPVALPASAGAKTTNRSQCVPGAMTPFQLALARQ